MNGPAMESDIHDTCSGNGWSSCKNLNPLSLDCQSYMSISREHHVAPNMNKDCALAYNPFMALNYSQDLACLPPHHHLHHQHSANGRELWQCQGQEYVKRKSNSDLPYSLSNPLSRKSCNSKSLHASVDATSTAGDVPLQSNHACFPPFEMPLQQTQSFYPPFEDALGSCSATDQNVQMPSNLAISNCRTSVCRSDIPVVTSTRKRRKNPLPKKRVKSSKNDCQVKKKRSRNEDCWLRNRRKKARAKGESYVSVVGKTVPARSVKPVDCSKCKFDCQSRVTEEDRQKLFNSYWGLETFKEKVDFISTCVQEFVPLRPRSGKRAVSRRYKLIVNGKEERVCKEFFTSTLDVHESTIGTYMSKKRKHSDPIQDMRGKRAPSNKTPDSVLRKIREHILAQVGLQTSLDKVPLEETKNVKQLYMLYELECNEENVKPAGISVYRKVFTDLHKGKNTTPITLPPEEDFSRGVKYSQNHPDWTSKDTSRRETSISSTSVASTVGQIVFPNSPTHHDTYTKKDPVSDHSGIPSQQTETLSTAVPSVNSIQNEIISPCVKKKISSHGLNRPAFSTQINPVESQDGMQDGSPALPVFLHRNFHCHQSMQFSGTYSDEDGNDYTHNSGNDQPTAVSLPSSSGTFISNSQTHYSKSSSENCSTLNNYQPSQITCSEDDPQSFLPKHISSLQDSMDPIVLKPSQTAVSKSSQKQKSSTPNANERGSGNIKEDIINSQKSKTGNQVKKRQRNEEQWARNVRKRLRFKGEEYTSITGKKVEARKVQDVDCSKCKFKCPTRVSEEQREQINSIYWSLDSYEKKVAFIAKHVQTYQPKRKMTGRRAFSRNYTFEVDHKEVRVCKDFFQATLHIGQSTVTTSLEKTRRGPDAVKELRGKHTPVNKTPDAIVQDICELIIYITGLRPHRNHENVGLGHNVKSLYQAYVYDAEFKGNKVASMGIFRSVLRKKFGLSGISKVTRKEKD